MSAQDPPEPALNADDVRVLLDAWERLGIHGAASISGTQSLRVEDPEAGQLLVDRWAWSDFIRAIVALRAEHSDGRNRTSDVESDLHT